MKRTVRHDLLSLALAFIAFACAPTDYSWQYQYDLTRNDYELDLDECRAYAARQYHPGMPAGSPYVDEYQGYPHGYDWRDDTSTHAATNEWHPDRNPDRLTNLRQQPYHDVPRGFTGYPGELDYYPGYTDAILEKCMRDRGWVYQPEDQALGERGSRW